MGLRDRLLNALGFVSPSAPAIEQRAAETRAPYATVVRGISVNNAEMSRRSVRLLRNFADRNEALRTAINWRKQQISGSQWRIVRTDNRKAKPNPKVVAQATELFQFVNPGRMSLRSLLDQVIEDVLVLDAGCIEKEKTIGRASAVAGDIVALWPVDGGTIAPDPMWDQAKRFGGAECDPQAIRYRQKLDGTVTAELRNDQLIYIMANESTHRVLGLSPVEVLVNVIEAELYGEKYDFEMLKKAAPAGMLYLGAGLDTAQVDAFRDYYESEIEGDNAVAIFGGGTADSKPTFTKFGFSPDEMQREQYKTWLINKIAFVMQVDKQIFGLVDDVNKANGKNMSARTDQGFLALARLLSEYITREIIMEIDSDHGFAFTDLEVIDELTKAKTRQIYSQIGKTFPNEMRAQDGEDPVPWGDEPFNAQQSATPEEDDEAEPKDPEKDSKDENDPKGGKNAPPFVRSARTTRRTPKLKKGYLGN